MRPDPLTWTPADEPLLVRTADALVILGILEAVATGPGQPLDHLRSDAYQQAQKIRHRLGLGEPHA